jgi:hypothetical protein
MALVLVVCVAALIAALSVDEKTAVAPTPMATRVEPDAAPVVDEPQARDDEPAAEPEPRVEQKPAKSGAVDPKRPPRDRKKPRPPGRTAPARERLAYLEKHCPKLSCAARIMKEQPRPSWTMQERFRYDNVLSSCVALCAQ